MWLPGLKSISIISKPKLIISLLILFLLPLNIYSGDYGISSGVMGVGISSEKNFDNGYFYGHFLDFVYQSEIGFGVEVSPISISWNMKDTNVLASTFVNTTVFYDFIKQENLVFGPFTTIHMLENKQLDYFGLQSGLLFSIREFDDDSILFFNITNIINVELGYSFTNGTSAFYAQVGIDAIGLIVLYIEERQREAENYKKGNNEQPEI